MKTLVACQLIVEHSEGVTATDIAAGVELLAGTTIVYWPEHSAVIDEVQGVEVRDA